MPSKFYPLYHQGELDPQSESILELIANSNGAPLVTQTPEEARKSFLEKEWLGEYVEKITRTNFVTDEEHGKVPVRIYKPEGEEVLPIVVFFHGGGFVLGNLDEFDPFCSFIASGAGCIVASVDYRLAPEHKHPTAVEDAFNALAWIAENAAKFNGDAKRIAVAGDSAGANLSLVSAIAAYKKGAPELCYMALICPWVNLSSTTTDSYRYFGKGLWLSTENIGWYRNHYLQNIEQAKSPMVSPLLAESLKGLPPALVLTAEFDVLRDEGKALADRLEQDGVQVIYTCYKGMLHDFVSVPGLFDKAKEAIDEICVSIKNAFNK